MKKYVSFLGISLSIAACVYFSFFIRKHYSDLPTIEANPLTYVNFFIAITICCLPIFFGGMAWHLLLRSLSQKPSLKDSLLVFTISQFGKYLPGNIGHHIGRVSLSISNGLSLTSTLFALCIEILLSTISGVIFSLIFLFTNKSQGLIFQNFQYKSMTLFIAALFFSVILFCFFYFRKTFNSNFITSFFNYILSFNNKIIFLSNILLYLIGLFCIGIVINLLATTIYNAPQGNIFVLTGIFSLAWTAGFITPGAPAGLGVRETILVTMLEPLYGPGISLGISAFLRIITTSSDGLTFLIALAAQKGILRFSHRN